MGEKLLRKAPDAITHISASYRRRTYKNSIIWYGAKRGLLHNCERRSKKNRYL